MVRPHMRLAAYKALAWTKRLGLTLWEWAKLLLVQAVALYAQSASMQWNGARAVQFAV